MQPPPLQITERNVAALRMAARALAMLTPLASSTTSEEWAHSRDEREIIVYALFVHLPTSPPPVAHEVKGAIAAYLKCTKLGKDMMHKCLRPKLYALQGQGPLKLAEVKELLVVV